MSRFPGRPGPVRAAIAGGVVALAIVAAAAVLTGGGGDGDAMGAGDAVDFAERAFDATGVDAEVGEAQRGTFGLGPLATDVWIVPATVGGRQISLSVDADGDRAVNLADQLADGTNVLTAEQFDELAQFRFDPTDGDVALPAGVGVGAAVTVAVFLGAAVRGGRVAFPAV